MAKKRRRPSAGNLLALCLVAGAAAFAPAIDSPLVSDDRLAIAANEFVVEQRGFVETFSNFSWWGRLRGDAPGYRPLVTLSFAWTWAAAGDRPAAFHLTNIALHVLMVALVWLLSRRLGLDDTETALAAGLFAVLPIHSEAVIWSVGRAELLAAICWTGGLIALLGYRRRGRAGDLAIAALALLAGLFSKENAITLLAAPPVLALMMPLPERRRRRDAVAAAVLVCVTVAYLGVRFAAGPLLPGNGPDLLDNPLSVVGPLGRVGGALSLLGRYLALTVWPHPLSIDYSFNALDIGEGFVGDGYSVLGLVALAALAETVRRFRRGRPAIAVGLLMAAAAYSIVSNSVLLIGTIMGERLFYLTTVGLCVAAGPLLGAAARATGNRGAAVVAAIALAYLAVDWTRAAAWSSPVTLFESAVAAYPDSARAHMELGVAYGADGRLEDAESAFGRAIAVKPDYGAAWYNWGNLYARAGRHERAIETYRSALEHLPRLTAGWYNLGVVYRSIGRYPDAAAALAAAVDLAPQDGRTQLVYGDTLLALGRNSEAVVAYTHALEGGADPAVARINRGVALERLRGCAAAVGDYVAVADALPHHTTAVGNAVNCLRALGREREARELLARSGSVANRQTGR